MKRRYKFPPIQEAVCELHFDREELLTTNQISTAGSIWAQEYPNQQIVEDKGVELRFNLGAAEVLNHDVGQRLIARTTDGHRIVQLSPSFLAVNQIAPYKGWSESFLKDITGRLTDIVDFLHIDRIKTINLRYIDRIVFPQVPLVWSDWFNISLPIPQSIPAIGGSFQCQYNQQLESDMFVSFSFVTLPTSSLETTTVLLDVTVTWNGKITVNEVSQPLERVHSPHNSIFNEMLTEKTQELLGAYESV